MTTRMGGVASLTFVLACGGEAASLPPFSWEGEHLRFGSTQPDSEVTEANLEYADDYTGYLKQILGAPESLVVDFYWLPGEGQRIPFCEIDIVGCARGAEVYSDLIVHEHELVHAVGSFHDNAFIPLEEGLAEYLGDDAEHPRPPVSGRPDEVMMEYAGAEAIPYPSYPLMGHFVSHVVGTYGLEPLLAYARPSDKYEAYASTEAHWERAFGVTLDAVVDEYDNYPICPAHLFRSDGFDCERREPVELFGDGPFEVAIGLDDPETLGPRYGEIWKTLAVDLPITGLYRVHPSLSNREDGSDIHVRISRCGTDCRDAADEAFYEPLVGVIASWCAQAGRHTIRISAPPETSAMIDLAVVPIPSGECE